jgi:hypothetical protein
MTLAPKAAFDPLTAAEWNELIGQLGAVSVNAADPTSRTTASTSYTSTLSPANICGVAFIAPPSGKVLVTWRAQLINSGVNFSAASFEVRTGSTVGSGTVHTASDDTRSINSASTAGEGSGAAEYVGGLVPGATYNVFLTHRVTAGTLTTLRRSIGAVPLQA